MIALLHGTLEFRDDPNIVINVNGVGYQVRCTRAVLAAAPGYGEQLKVHIYTHVKEDALDLYGFESREDLKLFEYFISVSGIGPKTALGIFSVGNRSDIVNAILRGDVTFFTAVPRLGRKNAQKLIIELKGKLGNAEDVDLSSDGESDNDVVIALKSFGYSTHEALTAFREVQEKGGSTSEKIRSALKYLGK